MLDIDNPAISFLAVRLWNFALRSAIEPRSLRLGWSGAESGLRVDAEELLDMYSWVLVSCCEFLDGLDELWLLEVKVLAPCDPG